MSSTKKPYDKDNFRDTLGDSYEHYYKAQKLETNQQYDEAYRQLLKSIESIANHIFILAETHDIHDKETKQARRKLQEALKARASNVVILVTTRPVKRKKNNYKQDIIKHSKGIATPEILEIAGLRAKKARDKKKKEESFSKSEIKDEDSKNEYKKSFSLKPAITKSLVAFANTRGGLLYIGIAETKDVLKEDNAITLNPNFAVVGVYSDIDTHRQNLFSYIRDSSNLKIDKLKVTVLDYKGKKIVKIRVSQTLNRTGELNFFKDEAYIRVDNANRKLTSKEVHDITTKMQMKFKATYS